MLVASLQAQNNFEARLSTIKQQLEAKSLTDIPSLKESATFSLVDAPIQELLRAIAEAHSLNINVDPSINVKITNNFTDVTVKDLIYFICKEYKLDVNFVNNILNFTYYKAPREPSLPYKPKQLNISYNQGEDKLTLSLSRDSIHLFARQLSDLTNKNVILAPGTTNVLMTGYIRDASFENGLDKIAFMNNLNLNKTEDDFYVLSNFENNGNSSKNVRRNRRSSNTTAVGDIFITKRSTNDTLISIDATDAPIVEIIKAASEKLNKDYVLFSPPPGNTTTKVSNISYDQLLAYLLQATPHTYKKQDNIYLIGERTKEGFRNTIFIKLQFRTVEEIDKIIPKELAEGVNMKVFEELNGLILSGAAPQIQEIKSFLDALDQPVPNILIEVIVVNTKNGFSIETGIKAAISDSVPKTSGTLFPTLDLTLSSSGVNDVLDKLTQNGIVNLGQVTPRFYMTLKALEDNNLLDVRSTPKLSTLNGHEANLSIGQSVYYKQETQNVTGGVNPIITTTPQFERVNADMSIKIKPVVSGDEHITLDIEAEFSEFIAAQVEGAPPGNATRKFISQIRVRNEEMIILGGLERAEKSENGSGVPFLSRIPVIKWFFSSRSRQKTDDRLIVFIKPTVVY